MITLMCGIKDYLHHHILVKTDLSKNLNQEGNLNWLMSLSLG